ncbi:hypothetical protein BOX15_Mlig010086g1 [Macrostomum lignano]|nr:hypothetical protein BOX15_Mlig010086g1 [Macrostomum lignano]
MKMVQGSQEYRGSQCTAQWYSEIEMYDFNGGENQMNCGHFSQVVWKSTKEAGFGKAMAPDGKMFTVGQYSPPGNFMNKWRANIPAPLSGEIWVPTRDDIMGGQSSQQQQQPQQPQQYIKQQPQQPQQYIKQQPQQPQQPQQSVISQGGGQEPDPADPSDRPVGKATKTRIVNGEKTVTVTVTFARPDGSRYQLSKETTTSQDGGSQPARPDIGQEMIIQPTRFRRNFAAPPTVSGNDGGGEDDAELRETFADEVAKQHNELRRRHGAPELRRSKSLDRLAQSWAELLSQSGRLQHRPAEDFNDASVGQNIAKRPAEDTSGWDWRQAGRQLVLQWYGERHRFDFGRPDPGDICGGHFSQLVWCSSEDLGVGLAVDPDTGDQYAACFYRPGGNLAGQFADNVLPSYD